MSNDVSDWVGGPEIALENFQVLSLAKTAGGTNASEAWWGRIDKGTLAMS